jgi:hypothetical protein
VVSPDGRETVRDRMVGSTQEPELVGQQLGQVLVSKGAGRILQLAGRTAANG